MPVEPTIKRMKLFSRRSAIAFAVLSATTLSLSGLTEPAPSAEALSTLRAKITWTSDLPRTLSDRLPSDTSSYALWRDNLLSRQSNADASREQVVTDRQFVDEVMFLPSLDIPEAVITVSQPSYRGNYHVRISVNDMEPATKIVLRRADDGSPALTAGVPVTMTIYSTVPSSSQVAVSKRTPKIFTSIIRIGDRIPGGTSVRTLYKPMTVRTLLQPNEWASRNRLATPTPIGTR